jgi:hypothetical protein
MHYDAKEQKSILKLLPEKRQLLELLATRISKEKNPEIFTSIRKLYCTMPLSYTLNKQSNNRNHYTAGTACKIAGCTR